MLKRNLNNLVLKLWKKNYIFLIQIITPLLLLIVWFKPGYLLARAEEGIPLYNPVATYNLLKYPFNDVVLGLSNPFHLPRITFFGFSAVLYTIGIDGWVIQMFLFYILLFVPLYSMPKVFKRLFPESNFSIGIYSSLFYLFNLYTLSQIWGRFLYPLIFLWSYLPLFFLQWVSYIESGSKRELVFFAICSLFYSSVFGIVASVFTLFIPVTLYSVILFVESRNKAMIIKNFLYISFLWVFINSWWIVPLIGLSDTTYGVILNDKANITSLADVSKYFDSKEILLLKQKYLFGENSDWYNFFQRNSIILTSKLVFVVTLLGLIVSRKQRNWKFLCILVFLSWFLIKGTNPPYGREFYDFIYKYIPVSQVLRNPYEKLGLVFVFSYALLFSFGLSYLLGYFSSVKKVVIVFTSLLFFVYLPFPLWSRTFFANSRIKVPTYYQDINKFINDSGDGRILHLPFLFGSGLNYSWGYSGEEPSDYIFENASVSRNLSIINLDDYYYMLGRSVRNENFFKLLSISDIRYLVIHNDTIKSSNFQEDFYSSKEIVNKLKRLKFIKEFGELELYSVESEIDISRVYASNNLILVNSLEEGVERILSDNFVLNKDAIFVIPQNGNFDYTTLSKTSYSNPKLLVSTISPIHFKVHIKEADESFILILANNFDKHWIAKVNDIEVLKHFEVNGFANGWVIDKLGKYTIDIVFETFLL